jgi:hypothetical protein
LPQFLSFQQGFLTLVCLRNLGHTEKVPKEDSDREWRMGWERRGAEEKQRGMEYSCFSEK